MKMKERDYPDYEEEDALRDSEDITDPGLEFDGGRGELPDNRPLNHRFRRTWRDTEKYREMRELYKMINDELYTGFFYPEEYLEDDEVK